MKKNIKLKVTTFICAALLVLSGCKDESYPDGPVFKEDEGGFSMAELVVDVNTAITPTYDSRGEDDDQPDISNYSVKIVYASTGLPVSNETQWAYKDMPEIVTLPVGKYRVEVESCDWSDKYAEWELPHYVGSADFEVKAGEITKADKVPCELKNIKVTVSFTENLKKVLSPETFALVTASYQADAAGNSVILKFARDEERSGYFRAVEDSRTMVTTLYPDGTEENKIINTMTDLKAGQHRVIVYDYIPSRPELPAETGTLSRSDIKIDVTVITVDMDGTVTVTENVLDPSDRPGQEEPLEPVDPEDPNVPTKDDVEIPNPGLGYFDLYKVNEVKKDDPAREYVLEINSESGFESLNVKIDSETLTSSILKGVGLSTEFDLATGKSVDGDDLSDGLASIGFPVGDKVTGDGITNIKFNITEFIPLLCIYGEANHNFILTVVPKEGESKTITLQFRSK